ncbi:molybdenum cofactor biosynthesis protein C [Moraxella atlantae]|uniref:cyclic pyranopterin monophosphate synthase n=1 Tax=Faucicola atlantae TaxID=34059 RepID=A0A1B8QFA2_9GAMM|nr:cyclic pyranopterin monophosphate synthase MoaC [Moraxella atlantae]OBX80604.1 molybdenum cofactor biosynthesis protein C [Moraxella atlantae]OPH34531.1 cyclic pyranopterin monophosphate synthase MoaC [Moraxella atlantae]STY95539.1 Molybdenum cofactor biosynthesis protein C [Moraxella atlantae]
MTTNQPTSSVTAQPQLSHVTADGDIHMVDVSAKTITTRQARATGTVSFDQTVYVQLKACAGVTKKGSITQTAHIAGIMAAKKTSELIPLCHAIALTGIDMQFTYDDAHAAITVNATVRASDQTGVEMEALTAVSVACLTLYDMTKALSHDITIGDIKLISKTGGKSDYVSH